MSHRTGPAPLSGRPRRLATCSPTHTGIVIGCEPTNLGPVRRWATHATRATPSLSQDVALAASELTTNAFKHTRSGQTGGRVVIELITTHDHYLLRVTDDGPRPGQDTAYPRLCDTAPGEEPTGLGLRLVEALSTRWDWSLNTDGTVSVQVRFTYKGGPR